MGKKCKQTTKLAKLYIGFFGACYAILKLLPMQANKILFLSRQTNKPSIDYRMLSAELLKQEPNLKIVTITKRIQKNMKEVLLKNTPRMFRQMYHLATAKVCIVDGYNIAVSVLRHKQHLRVIQIWHSLGAIKKFGKQALNTPKAEAIAQAFKMHNNYDVIISPSKTSVPAFAQAFGYPKSSFKICGLPRVDYLYDQREINRQKILQKYPKLIDKPIVLYAPTFREGPSTNKMRQLIAAVDTRRFNLIVKLHPNTKLSYKPRTGIYTCQEFTVLQLLSVVDYVVTDYSAISLEAAVIGIPTYLYLYDLPQYQKHPGLNVDLVAELPKCVFTDAEQLAQKLGRGRYPFSDLQKYAEKYIQNSDNNNTNRLAKLVLQEMRHA